MPYVKMQDIYHAGYLWHGHCGMHPLQFHKILVLAYIIFVFTGVIIWLINQITDPITDQLIYKFNHSVPIDSMDQLQG